MAEPANDRWPEMVKAQPALTEEDKAPAASAKAESFAIELAGENLLLKIKREDGRVAVVELSPDMAFYLREYLSNGLATIGWIPSGS
ncbi:MAG: hypothetical protein HQ481_21870 [Alphaproteobacteria bacterium]|nr:hypothetical protein [Alphaproteobacteria bacterium]